MGITKITPRMQKAFTDGKRPFYAADIWLSVNNGMIDTKEDFDASVLQSQMDFATKPGFARLAIQQGAFNVSQATGGSTFDGGSYTDNEQQTIAYGVQKIRVTPGRQLSSITVKINNTGPTDDCIVELYNQDPALTSKNVTYRIGEDGYTLWKSNLSGLLFSLGKSVASLYNGPVVFNFGPVSLPEGDYWILVRLQSGAIYYNTSDVYAGGSLALLTANYFLPGYGWPVPICLIENVITPNIGDLYFELGLSGYHSSGTFKSKIMDLGETPIYPGSFQMAYDLPSGTTLTVSLTGSNNADMSGGTTYPVIADGQEIAAYRYWQTDNTLTADAVLYQTPLIDMQEVLFPKDRLRVREKVKLFNVSDDLQKNYQALLNPLEFTTSEINLIDRVSTGGSASAVLEDRTGDVIQQIISDSPLKNHRVMLYMGADVPGFGEQDLLRFFIGSVQAATYKPNYRGGTFQLPLAFKNPVLELKRKVPQPTQTGLLDFEVLAISYDGWHVMEAIIDVIRGKAGIPGRYVNLETIYAGKSSIGDADLPAAAFLVYRSNAVGLADTRIKSPTETVELLKALATIADGYITADESSRIAFVKHDFDAIPEAAWADEELVKTGVSAIPIMGMDSCDLGYDKYLYNTAICGCTWNGTGDKWESFAKTYAYANADSINDFGQGEDKFYSVMEKNLREPSKWLGPESGYNGETIAQWLAKKLANRFAYPPVVITGAVLPLNQFMRTQGSIVTIWSKRFTKFKRRGIALSETKKFMVLSKKLNDARTQCIFNLVELT